jgi:SPFH domain / Band 7 family
MVFIDIKENEVGIVYKKFGRPLPAGRRIAVNGEIGLQADILSPGRHLNLPNVEIRKVQAIEIASDEVGLVEAKDGASLPPGQNFGKVVECNDFRDAKAFINNGGQKGKQRDILTTGTHHINTELFSVEIVNAIRIRGNEVGLVESRDGKPLPPGRSFGKVVECHDFQNAQAFVDNGGESGKQLAILTSGTYQINSNFFKVRRVPCTQIKKDEIGLIRATSGKPLTTSRTFGKVIECDNFQDPQAFINNGGESGKQLAILTPGIYQINTDLFEIKIDSVTKVPQGEIGLVVANDGSTRPEDRNLGKVIECHNFEDAQAFINNGGESGKQLAVIPAKNYQINTDLFTVITTANAVQYDLKTEDLKIYKVGKDKIGIVTTLEGKTLPDEEIASPVIPGHDNFQKPQKFIEAGGYKGLQQEFLQEGSWTLNPWFVSIEQVPLIEIVAEQVGVVISYIGKTVDRDSENDRRLVEAGYKGIQKKALLPGKYTINTRIKSVQVVPTNEIILNWSRSEDKPDENYDKTLEPLKLRSKDGFTFDMQITQIISIPEQEAPRMIMKVGTRTLASVISKQPNSVQDERLPAIRNLVTKVLGPMVDSHFRISAQKQEALDFLEKRSDVQQEAADYIQAALKDYGVQSIQTVITEIDLPDELEELLKQRKLLEEKGKNYTVEKLAEQEHQKLIEQQARNEGQSRLVIAEQDREIAAINAQAKLTEGQANAQIQQWNDTLDLKRKQQELEIEANHQQQLRLISIEEFRDKVSILSPAIYAQIESEGKWAEAYGNTQIKLPEVFISGGGGGDNSSGGDIVQASAMQMAFLEVLRDSIKSKREVNQINMPQQHELLPPSTND